MSLVRRPLLRATTLSLGGCAAITVMLATHQFGCSSGAAAPVAAVDDSSPDATAGDLGSIGLRLTLPGGETLDAIAWVITGPNGASTIVQQNTIDVTNSQSLIFQVGGIPAGSGYTIAISGTTVDGTVTCTGSAPFSVNARATTNVTALLQCNAKAPEAGSVAVSTLGYDCGIATGVSASPSETTVGNSVSLTGVGKGVDPGSVAFAWSATSGTFSAPGSAATNFTCTAPGPVTVTLTVSDGAVPDGGSCNAGTSTMTTQVNCDSSDGGSTQPVCSLGGGAIKHVIYVQFDNTHLTRDLPNVPSDLEQMPHLLSFIRNNGTMMANDHTVLISHTAGGFLSSFTGVYPDRNGQTVTNSYVRTTASGFAFPSSFAYWTDPTVAGSTIPNMVGPDGSNIPAPWVSYTRAGCNVGAVGGANIVLENTGTGSSGDITTVFGTGSAQFAEATTSNMASSGSAARNLAVTDFEGLAIHCAQGSTTCATGESDSLPQEPGGYTGFKGMFGAQQIDPLLTGQAASVPLTDLAGQPIQDSFGQPGFPGFNGMEAAVSLAYVAAMQEHGVPVTYAYISDAHDSHGVDGSGQAAFGPGDPGYVAQLAAYDAAFNNFFIRLAADGIDKTNTLFVFTVDEGDHFVGSAPSNPTCDGVTTPCNWPANTVGELNSNIDTLVSNQFPALATTFLNSGAPDTFTVHGDDAPTFYLAQRNVGPLSQTDPNTRAFERSLANLTAVNQYTGNTDSLLFQMADQTGMKAFHMVTTGDPTRNPTFVYFADDDYFITDFPSSTCLTCINPAFAWNHGDAQSVIGQTWLGFVGPGVKNQADQTIFTDHTDVRPTINSILGLHDTYQSDGRVITQALTSAAISPALASNQSTVESLGDAYKQINAPFGPFAGSILTASTTALRSDDPTYTSLEASIANLVSQRDTLATSIRSALDGAEFGSTAIDSTQAQTWITQAQSLLSQAATLATTPPSDAGAPGGGDASTPSDAGAPQDAGSSPPDAGGGAGGSGTTADLDIYRVGDGTTALINTGNPVFIDEFSQAGALVRSIPMPTATNGANHRLIASGTATSEGLLTLSADGHFLVLGGYDAPIPTTGLVGTASTATPRTVGRVDSSGNVDTTTGLTDWATGNNPRGVASPNGTDFWVTGAAGGVLHATLGASTSTSISTTVVNLRQPEIFAGQLYVDTSSQSLFRIGTVGTGIPTTGGTAITGLPGFATGTGSPYGFFLADLDGNPGLDTLYVSDDGVGLTKYSLVSGSWVSNGTVGAATDLYRGLTGFVNGTQVTLFATRGVGATTLVSVVDSSGFNEPISGAPTLLATAGANTAFRGVAFAPQP